MQFNSFLFILAFMPLITIVYYISNKINTTLSKVILAAGSLFFYAYTNISLSGILLLSIVLNYIFALCVSKLKWKRIFLAAPVVINVFLLIYFKYTDFVIFNVNRFFGKDIALRNIVLPIGISFFTFQQIAYVVSVYRCEITTDALDYLVYILYFPKILMGPLMEPSDFFSQINDPKLKKVNLDNVAAGIKLFSFGLFKKMLLADTFSNAVNWGYGNFEAATSIDWLLIMLFYTFEIYFDFSGYSDMATGVSLILNIQLPINFDSPYKAISIRDFWKRWHISLTKFLTKYIYIPLGGSRKGRIFTYINTMIVFLISGIWHGASWTFILWGVCHGLFNVFDRFIEEKKIKLYEPARWLLTFGIVNVLWLLFRSDSIMQFKAILTTIVKFDNATISEGLKNTFFIPEATFIMNCVPIIDKLNIYISGLWMRIHIWVASFICFFPDNNYTRRYNLSWLSIFAAAVAFVWGIICIGSNISTFVYFGF